MLEPPNLDSPFQDESERASVMATFLTACVQLEEWKDLAQGLSAISAHQREVLQRSLEKGDFPEQKLQRWATLFDDEIEAAFASRNRIAHGIKINDRELRGAHWLALHLLELITSSKAV